MNKELVNEILIKLLAAQQAIADNLEAQAKLTISLKEMLEADNGR